ncbi:MAG: hypothetical protein FWD04_02740 [Conexibacteraceae bacterium]|nr:hypothetical protein [Conexibacteraceae bacterium]
MRNPSSIIRGRIRPRRPSPAMLVALTALFLSLGGVGYAATLLPAGSVGQAQLRTFAVTNRALATAAVGTRKIMDNAVTFNKIAPSSVGVVRIVRNQVQLRVNNTCAAGQAMTAIDVNGRATCAATSGAVSRSTPGSAVAVDSATAPATVNEQQLASGSAYLVQSNPYLTVTPTTVSGASAQDVVVTCTLTAGTEAAQRSATFTALQPSGPVENESIPLTVAVPSLTAAAIATTSCVSTATNSQGAAATNPPTITAQGQSFASQAASVTTAPVITTPTPTPTPPIAP